VGEGWRRDEEEEEGEKKRGDRGEGGREAGRQGGREAGRQGGREARRQGGREAGRQGEGRGEGEREGKVYLVLFILQPETLGLLQDDPLAVSERTGLQQNVGGLCKPPRATCYFGYFEEVAGNLDIVREVPGSLSSLQAPSRLCSSEIPGAKPANFFPKIPCRVFSVAQQNSIGQKWL
jgi:hypothetical protein